MSRPAERPDRPNVAIRRRPSDFLGRGEVLLQGACCACCCCCCCLHWVGAAVGGTMGIVGPLRADKRKRTPPVHPMARRYVIRATWIAIVVVAAVSAPIPGCTLALAFLPSLACLPVGAAAMLGAALARKTEAWRMADAEERQRISAGMGLAWRIAWKSFVWATFASGIGYLAMYLVALAMD